MNKKQYHVPETKLFEFTGPLMTTQESQEQTGTTTPSNPGGGSGTDLTKRRYKYDDYDDESIW